MEKQSSLKTHLINPGGVFTCKNNKEWTLLHADQSSYEFLGYDEETFQTKFSSQLIRVIHEEDVNGLHESIEMDLKNASFLTNEVRVICKEGLRWIWVSAQFIEDEEQGHFYCMFHDVTKQKKAREELQLNEQRYDLILSHTQDIIIEVCCKTKDIYVSPNFYKKFGYNAPPTNFPKSIIDANMIHQEDIFVFLDFAKRFEEGQDESKCECRIRKEDGTYIWVRNDFNAIRDEEGNLLKILGMISDIDKQKNNELHTQKQLQQDPLTNLYNRIASEQLIQKYIENETDDACLFVIDIDDFKGVNDSLGHIYGDTLLRNLSLRLKTCVRDDAIVGRVGGDEFIVFLGHIKQDEITFYIEQIQQVFRSYLLGEDMPYPVTGSIGVSCYPKDGDSYQQLFNHADMAMYHAKSSGKDKSCLYDDIQNVSFSEYQALNQTPTNHISYRNQLVDYVFDVLQNEPDFENSIPMLLELVGNLYHGCRVYIYELQRETHIMENTFEWCQTSVASKRESFTLEDYRNAQVFIHNSVSVCNDTRQLSNQKCKQWLENRNVKSILAGVIKEYELPTVIFGFENCVAYDAIDMEARYTLSLISETIGLFLLQARKSLIREEQKYVYDEMLKHNDTIMYAIDPESYQLLFSTLETGEERGTCYKILHDFDKPCPNCLMKKLSESCRSARRNIYYEKTKQWRDTTIKRIRFSNGKEVYAVYSYDTTLYHNSQYHIELLNAYYPFGHFICYNQENYPVFRVNKQMLNYMGYESEEAFMEDTKGIISSRIPKKEQYAILSSMQKQLKEKEEYRIEYRLQTKQKKYIWLRETGKRVVLDSGEDVLLCFCEDITRQKELTRQLELYRKTSHGGTIVFDLDTYELLYGNEYFYQVCKREKQSNEQQPIYCIDYVHPQDALHIKELIANAQIHKQRYLEWEMRVCSNEGKWHWMLIYGEIDMSGDQKVMNCFICDIDEKHKLQEQIMHNEQCYRIALQRTNTSVWEYDIANSCLILTKSAQQRHGYRNRVEHVPETLIEEGHIHPNSIEDVKRMYERLQRGEQNVEADILTRKLDASGWWWERIQYTMMYDELGNASYAIAVGEDITKEKEAEIRYQQELQFRNKLDPDVISSSRINMSKNELEYLRLMGEPYVPTSKHMTYEDMTEMAICRIANANDQQNYIRNFSRPALLKAFTQNNMTLSLDYRRKDDQGLLQWVNETVQLVKDVISNDIYAYVLIRNINEKKILELSLQQRAERDTLTKTYRTETIIQMMKEVLSQRSNTHISYALLLFNLDDYAAIKKGNGQESADHVLVELSKLLMLHFGNKKIVGRFGEDEIGVFLYGKINEQKTYKTADDIRKVICMPYMFTKGKIAVSVSVGLYFEQEKTTFEQLYENAKEALSEAKEAGKNCCMIYDKDKVQKHETMQYANMAMNNKREKNVVLKCAYSLITSTNFDTSLVEVLKGLTQYYDADRAYVLQVYKNGKEIEKIYEYKKDNLASLSKQDVIEWFSHIENKEALEVMKNEPIHYTRKSIKEISSPTYTRLFEHDIDSVYASTMKDEDNIVGYMILENPREHLDDTEVIDTLHKFILNEFNRQRLKKQQEILIYHDDLTGVYNMKKYKEYCKKVVEESLISIGILSLDINGLKKINIELGNEYGDNLLNFIAKTLKGYFASGNIFRQSGDEFLVICENITQDAFMDAITICKAVFEKSYPSVISFGYIWEENDMHIHEMIQYAQERRKIAKRKYYSTGNENSGHVKMLENLLTAIERGEFEVYLQPKADMKTTEVMGAEALIRYKDAKLGFIPPIKFIPLLEKEGLIHYIDLFVFDKVCEQMALWQKEGKKQLTISLNFSRSTLLEDDLLQQIDELVQRHNIDKKYIEIEITESLGEVEKRSVVALANQLADAGYRLSLDDFGASFSNISLLSDMNLDVLKLDKSLVNNLISSKKNCIVIQNVIQICHELGIEVIAEGVETNEQLEILKQMKCDYVQGYLLNKPLPINDFEYIYLHDSFT